MRRSTIILLGIALIFVGFVFYLLFHVEPLRISGEHLVRLGQGVVVKGTVTNAGQRAQKAVIQVRLYDGAGHQLGRQTVSVGKLEPGRSQPFSTPVYAAGGVQKFTVQVDHGTNMYGN